MSSVKVRWRGKISRSLLATFRHSVQATPVRGACCASGMLSESWHRVGRYEVFQILDQDRWTVANEKESVS